MHCVCVRACVCKQSLSTNCILMRNNLQVVREQTPSFSYNAIVKSHIITKSFPQYCPFSMLNILVRQRHECEGDLTVSCDLPLVSCDRPLASFIMAERSACIVSSMRGTGRKKFGIAVLVAPFVVTLA